MYGWVTPEEIHFLENMCYWILMIMIVKRNSGISGIIILTANNVESSADTFKKSCVTIN